MNESVLKTIGVAFSVCLVCSLIVSISAVSLRDLQNENKLNDRRIKVLEVADIKIEADQTIAEQFSKLEQKFVDFDTGQLMDEYKDFKIDDYDPIIATKDKNLSSKVPQSDDIAIIKNRENVGKIFILRDDKGNIDKLILPIRGYGLWGTLFGYIAIEGDFNTVSGITYYEHKETPGLGAEVDNPKWKAQWKGKKLNNENGELMIQVAKTQKYKDHHIDALAGATLTSNGVDNLVKFWMGKDGFQKFLNNLKNGAA